MVQNRGWFLLEEAADTLYSRGRNSSVRKAVPEAQVSIRTFYVAKSAAHASVARHTRQHNTAASRDSRLVSLKRGGTRGPIGFGPFTG